MREAAAYPAAGREDREDRRRRNRPCGCTAIGKTIVLSERSHTMGDKGGKKDKNKTQKQKTAKQEQQAQKQQQKQKEQQKTTP
jgi:hypothetical protein